MASDLNGHGRLVTKHSPPSSPSSLPLDSASLEGDSYTRPDLPRRSSIAWHPSSHDSKLERRRSLMTAGAMERESTDDEHTAILERERGGGRDYSTIVRSDEPLTRPLRRTSTASKRRGSPMPARRPEPPEEDRSEGWWKKMMHKYGSIELENRGAVARDHLALERTFLAWLRTSLSFASIGIAVTQLFRLNASLRGTPGESTGHIRLRQVGKPLGATFLAIAILILVVGFHRYFESQHYVIQGKFPASRGSIIIITSVAGALIIASFVVILTVAPQSLD